MKRWQWKGYDGYQGEGFRYGMRNEEGIVILSGLRASEDWQEFAVKARRCTRIDLAVTVTLKEKDTGLASRLYRSGVERNDANLGYVERSIGGSTLYLGSRTSERYGRLYDKGAHLGKE